MQIRIRIYSLLEKHLNTNKNSIRFEDICRIRIRISLFGLNISNIIRIPNHSLTTGPECLSHIYKDGLIRPQLEIIGNLRNQYRQCERNIIDVAENRLSLTPISDNACAADKSSLRRFPHRVRKWTFLCDRTHWKNHTACQKGYNMEIYPMLKGVNGQQAEQINRSLRRLSVVLAFSTLEHYMKILETYFVYKNVKTRRML